MNLSLEGRAAVVTGASEEVALALQKHPPKLERPSLSLFQPIRRAQTILNGSERVDSSIMDGDVELSKLLLRYRKQRLNFSGHGDVALNSDGLTPLCHDVRYDWIDEMQQR